MIKLSFNQNHTTTAEITIMITTSPVTNTARKLRRKVNSKKVIKQTRKTARKKPYNHIFKIIQRTYATNSM